jgi:hypothetical protein
MSYSILRLSRKTPVFVLTVQWASNPLCTYTLYCVPYSVVYLRTKIAELSVPYIAVLCTYHFRRSALDLFQILIIIIRL